MSGRGNERARQGPCHGALATLLLLAFPWGASAQSLPWEVWTSPSSLARLEPRQQVLMRSSRCPGGCRYDRDGRGPESPAENPYPDRWLYRTGSELTVFDEPGPGALTRIWMTTGFGSSTCIDPAIRVRFYLDGAAAPEVDLPLPRLFDGTVAPWQPPLVADRAASSGGFVSYVPVAYARGLRITLQDVAGTPNPCTGNNQHLLWYQFTHHRLPGEFAPTSFAAGATFPAFATWLGHQGDDPWDGLLASQDEVQGLAPGQSVVLDGRTGSGWLRGLRLRLPRAAWPYVRLILRLDGVVAADLRLDRFFATSVDAAVPPRSPLLGEDAGGWLYAWLPMPFRDGSRVELVASSDLPAAVVVASALSFDSSPVPPQAGRFFARASSACGSADVPVFAHRGAGRVVGISARHRAASVASLGYLEGDERVRVDGSPHPSWYGTGVEDFYNGGFYFDHGAFGSAFAGASTTDASGAGATHAWRILPTDGLSFQSAIDWRVEAGFAPDMPVPLCSDTVIYGYAQPLPALVPYARLELDDPAALARHQYEAPPAAACATVDGAYEDEPPTPRTARVCRYGSGSSTFRFVLPVAAPPLRLRRVFDAAVPNVPAEVWVNGGLAGHFGFTAADPLRRWKEDDAVLSVPLAPSGYDVEIRPQFLAAGGATTFSESAYELWGGWIDAIFSDGFDAPAKVRLTQGAAVSTAALVQ